MKPGRQTTRFIASYNSHQEALWQALAAAYYAHEYDFEETRQPRPGSIIDRHRYEAWVARVVERWNYEADSRGSGHSRGIQRDDWPEHLWQYMYQRMLAAPPDCLRLPEHEGQFYAELIELM